MKTYRSGVGKLLYLIKISRPDLSNTRRELSKVMDKANQEHMDMLMRTLKFVVDTKDSVILIKKDTQEPIKLIGYTDSSFATDKYTRLSVTGIRYLLQQVKLPGNPRPNPLSHFQAWNQNMSLFQCASWK